MNNYGCHDQPTICDWEAVLRNNNVTVNTTEEFTRCLYVFQLTCFILGHEQRRIKPHITFVWVSKISTRSHHKDSSQQPASTMFCMTWSNSPKQQAALVCIRHSIRESGKTRTANTNRKQSSAGLTFSHNSGSPQTVSAHQHWPSSGFPVDSADRGRAVTVLSYNSH